MEPPRHPRVRTRSRSSGGLHRAPKTLACSRLLSDESALAIYHLHVKNIGRRFGRSIVAAAAYRAGETLPNEAEERESRFGGRRDVVHSEIRLPPGAPPWMADRARLWNAVEAVEKRKDARLAKEIEFALPRELPPEAWLAVACEMADAYTSRGHVVDLAIHDDGLRRNPHVHLLLSTRVAGPGGFGGKLRVADSPRFVHEARARWAEIANAALGKAGSAVTIDERSHASRGVEEEPGRHRGPNPDERRERRAVATAFREKMMTNSRDRDAYEQLTGAVGVERMFPTLARRADWPPVSREAPEDLRPDEAREFSLFWKEVDSRAAEREQGERKTPAADDARPQPRREEEGPHSAEASGRARSLFERFGRDSVVAGAVRDFENLERRLHTRMQAEGYDPGQPTDWPEIMAGMAEFREKLISLETLEQENRLFRERFEAQRREDAERYPVPDPQGELVSVLEIREAEARMIEEVEREDYPAPPHVSDMDGVGGLAAARAEIDRQNEAEPKRTPSHDDDLDWISDRLQERPSERGPERERHR